MQTTSLGLEHSAALSALLLSTLLVGCGSSAMTGQQGIDAAGRDVTKGAGGTTGSNGGAGGTFGTAGAGGGTGGGGHAAGGTSGAGGITGDGGASAAGGSMGTGGTTRSGGTGAGGSVTSGGREGTGGRSGAGGSLSIDAGVDAPSGCPAQLPISGGACQGPLTCTYGQTSCCGRSSSAWTCTCSGGSFSCVQTVECNIVCPGQDAATGVDSGRPDTPPRPDVSSIDSSSLGAACGGPTDPPCADFTYCDFSDNRCGSDMPGTCAAIPRGALCAIAPAPVCGCDGKNYAGQCQAEQAGTDVNQLGTCTPPAGMFRCGWSYCQPGSEYCYGQVGGAVTNPGSYSCKAVPAACNGTPSCGCVGGAGTFCTVDAQGDVTVTLPVP